MVTSSNTCVRRCEVCKTKFSVKNIYAKIGGGRFCSNKCRFEWYQQHSVQKICLKCHTSFLVDLNYSDKGGGKFCSLSCWRQYQKTKHIQKVCKECRKNFEVSTSYGLQEGNKRRFCSQNCYKNYRKRQNDFLVCKNCGNKFRYQRAVKIRQFCSRDCFRKARGIIKGKVRRTCEVCKKEFSVYGSRVKKGQARFCSIDCYLCAWVKIQQLKPNKSELYLQKLIEEVAPGEYRLNVLGNTVIERKIPDFVNINGQKKVIELFGEHVHPPSDESNRIATFKKSGYTTLVIWSRELRYPENVKKKLQAFSN